MIRINILVYIKIVRPGRRGGHGRRTVVDVAVAPPACDQVNTLIDDPRRQSIKVLFGQDCFAIYGENYGPLCEGLAVLLVFWMILFWMYRRKIFLRI